MKFDLSQDFSGRRCTKRDEYGNADIKGVDMQFMLGLDYEQMNTMQIALNRLADFEDAQTHGKRTDTHDVCSDTISRQAVIDAIEHVTWYHQNRNGQMVSGANSDEHQAWYKADDIYKALEAVPSADRPQGEWIDRGMRVPSSWVKKCSLCGHETDTWRWCNFCPNCGADMKGSGE